MSSQPMTRTGLAIVWWSVLGIVALLGQAMVRLLPRALEPVLDGSLDVIGALVYAASILFFGYSEGYRGFQRGFSPRVVVRAFALARRKPAKTKTALVLVAPLVAMGLIHATRRRLIGSWTLLAGIIGLILLVSLLEQPWRGAVDAGVVVGLSWGIVATVGLLIRALRGRVPDVDPQLPDPKLPDPSPDELRPA